MLSGNRLMGILFEELKFGLKNGGLDEVIHQHGLGRVKPSSVLFHTIVKSFHFKAVTIFSTDRPTDRPTDRKPSYRSSFTELKNRERYAL